MLSSTSADINEYLSVCTLTRLLGGGRSVGELFHVGCGDDANVAMRMAQLCSIFGDDDAACATLSTALTLRRSYLLAAARQPAQLRLLVILKPGFALDNTPFEYLLEESDVTCELLYVTADAALPACLPAHDVLFIAIGQFLHNRVYFERIAPLLEQCTGPVLNRPPAAFGCERDRVSALLQGIAGLLVPATRVVDRAALSRLTDLAAPLIVRPLRSQAGLGLARVGDGAAIAAYLARQSEDAFYVSPFVDYAGADGLYCKCRVLLLRGQPYVCHLGIAEHWMVHYKSAGMEHSAARRAMEARFMADSAHGFCRRHAAAFGEIASRLALDYVVVDCAEMLDGQLLFFEADNVGIVHAMDAAPPFDYKAAQMRTVFAAFRALLDTCRAEAAAPSFSCLR